MEINVFAAFLHLPVELQKESIREGELRLQAQLHAATAADQRALTWAGFLIAAATAALGGGVALAIKNAPEIWMATIAIGFAAIALYASWLAIGTVTPRLFCFPGNRPGNWLPDQKIAASEEQSYIASQRADQARHIHNAISDNALLAAELARQMKTSFKLAIIAVMGAGGLLLFTLITRNVTIEEPNSKFAIRHPKVSAHDGRKSEGH